MADPRQPIPPAPQLRSDGAELPSWLIATLSVGGSLGFATIVLVIVRSLQGGR